MQTIQQLNDALVAIAPIYGVSIGNINDKTTWRIDFKSNASNLEIQSANIFLQNFDFNVESTAEYAIQSKNEAQAYISIFFTNIELLHIFQILLQGSPTKKAMCLEVQNWINSIVDEALNHASSPDFEQFTPPPFTYLQILEAN